MKKKKACMRLNGARVAAEAETVAACLHSLFHKRDNDRFSSVAQFHLIRVRHQCSGEVRETILHVLVRLRARLDVRQAFLLHVVLDLSIGDHST